MTRNKVSCVDCKNLNCLIKKCCPASMLEEIESHKFLNCFPEKQRIFQEGNRMENISFIRSGIVKVFKKGAFNKNQTVRFSTGGNILGHRGVSSSEIYPVSSESQTFAEICCFPKEFFFELLNKVPEFTMKMMFLYSNELNYEESKLRDMSVFTVHEKGVKAILILRDTLGINENNELQNIENFNRQDIAELVGLTSNQLSKVLSELKSNGTIEIEGNKIKIVSIKELEEVVNY